MNCSNNKTLYDASNKLGTDIQHVRYTIGGVKSGTVYSKSTKLSTIIIDMLGDYGNRPIDSSTPNTRYSVKSLGTWNSKTDVDNFLIDCCYDTGYYGATVGSYVKIMDGTYNIEWQIVGFDLENLRTASDGTALNNGHGIYMIPKGKLFNAMWDTTGTSKGYIGSTMHTTTLPTVASNMRAILGDHMQSRKVLLSSSVNSSNYYASGYQWTNAYMTLLSYGQLTGTFAANHNKYDDGEANTQLPLFKYQSFTSDASYTFLRNIYGNGINNGFIYYVTSSGTYSGRSCNNTYNVMPMMMLS